MKKYLRFPALIFVIFFFISLFSLACRNPNSYKTAWKISKNYVDDLFRHVSKTKGLAPVAGRYTYTAKELLSARIAFKTVLPIYNSSGHIVSHSIGKGSLQVLKDSYRKDFYVVLHRTMQMLESRRVYHSQILNEITNLVNASDDLVVNNIQFNKSTGELIISSTSYYTRINYYQVLIDITKVNLAGYIVLKKM
jgi:hypothetical protein